MAAAEPESPLSARATLLGMAKVASVSKTIARTVKSHETATPNDLAIAGLPGWREVVLIPHKGTT
jgi:hypothetical protein